MSRLAEMHREMQENGTLPRGSKVDSRTGIVLRRNRGVRRALKWRKRVEATERQALLISMGTQVKCRHARQGKNPAPLEAF